MTLEDRHVATCEIEFCATCAVILGLGEETREKHHPESVLREDFKEEPPFWIEFENRDEES